MSDVSLDVECGDWGDVDTLSWEFSLDRDSEVGRGLDSTVDWGPLDSALLGFLPGEGLTVLLAGSGPSVVKKEENKLMKLRHVKLAFHVLRKINNAKQS